jgi:ribonucleoside-diphosphate reductase alpha chain
VTPPDRGSRITLIRKRDGRLVPFEPRKIAIAIEKAFRAVGEADEAESQELAGRVVSRLEKDLKGRTPSVEEVQDVVERVLIDEGYGRVAKAYILYREERTRIREAKDLFEVRDDLKLSVNAVKVLRNRYLLRDDQGRIVETPSGLFRRVAKSLAAGESRYGGDVSAMEEVFYGMLSRLEFLPNSPTLMNAGTEIGQLSACFVLPIPDSIRGIFDALKYMAIIHQSGGGTGFSFSRIRPRGDLVGSTKGIASGPLSFLRIFDTTTDVIKQGGRRRGANMGILRYDHPDILEFITAKGAEGALLNFNISVAVTDAFMAAVEGGEDYPLINPRSGEEVRTLNAREVFDLIVAHAWKTGDPGLIFLDEINRYNPTPQVGEMEATNPCGEQPLLPYESCNLGSINLAKMYSEGEFDWEKFRETIHASIRFLDNVIDANRYPLEETREITQANRKIGLGFAELLIREGIPYDTEEALSKGEEVMAFLSREAVKASQDLASERGPFPHFEGSRWAEAGQEERRNATVTTVAPTGTISIIAGTVSGIEPLFAVSYLRSVMGGVQLLEVNPLFERTAKKRGFYSRELMREIARRGSVQGMSEVPEEVQRLFVTALDIEPEWHIRMQAAFQRHTENAVSKTVNLPEEATPEDVRKAYLLAHRLKCKGTTVYRYGSKKEQVLYIRPPRREVEAVRAVQVDAEYAGGCPTETCF